MLVCLALGRGCGSLLVSLEHELVAGCGQRVCSLSGDGHGALGEGDRSACSHGLGGEVGGEQATEASCQRTFLAWFCSPGWLLSGRDRSALERASNIPGAKMRSPSLHVVQTCGQGLGELSATL